jgi:hypothetical protein
MVKVAYSTYDGYARFQAIPAFSYVNDEQVTRVS